MVLDAPTSWPWFEHSLDGPGAPLDVVDDLLEPFGSADPVTGDDLPPTSEVLDLVDLVDLADVADDVSGWLEPIDVTITSPTIDGDTDDVTGIAHATHATSAPVSPSIDQLISAAVERAWDDLSSSDGSSSGSMVSSGSSGPLAADRGAPEDDGFGGGVAPDQDTVFVGQLDDLSELDQLDQLDLQDHQDHQDDRDDHDDDVDLDS